MAMTRRRMIAALGAALTGTLIGASRAAAASKPTVTVYKSPT